MKAVILAGGLGTRLAEETGVRPIEGDDVAWEEGSIETLPSSFQLSVYHHSGFWQAMDTMRDKIRLEELWASGTAPWKVWR